MTAQLEVYQPKSLETALSLALDTVSSAGTKRHYARALMGFLGSDSRARFGFNRAGVHNWRASLEASGLDASTINVKLSAIRTLAREAARNGCLDELTAAGIEQVANVRQAGTRAGNWLTKQQAQKLIEAPDPATLQGSRDRAALSMLVGCGLRREEAAAVTFEHIQQRDGRWAIVDLRGKGKRIRTVPVPSWVKAAIDHWSLASGFATGPVLRAVDRHNRISIDGVTGKALHDWATRYGREIGVEIAPHDLRRTCAKLCRKSGGAIEQIQLLLGHASIQTTERYLGTTQDLENAPNDHMGLGWRAE